MLSGRGSPTHDTPETKKGGKFPLTDGLLEILSHRARISPIAKTDPIMPRVPT